MTIDISNNNPRVNYTVAQGVTQTSFTVPFEFFEDSDLNVYVDSVLKSITTHYTVTGGDGSTGTITMSVTGASGGSTVTITRDITIERVTDFSAGADIRRAALNTQLDTLTGIAADLNDLGGRALRVSDTEVAPSLEIPSLDTRKGTVLGFNETTGAPEIGPTIADVQTLAQISADIATLADIEDGTDATDAIQTVAGISSNVTTVAGISSNVTSVAGNSTNINTVAGQITPTNNVSTLAGVASSIATVAGISSNVTTVAGISSDVTTVAGDSADIQVVAANIGTIGQKATVDEAISFAIALG